MIQTIDDAYFNDFIQSTSTIILVDLWAEWCAPCKILAPILEELDKDYQNSLKIAKLNVDFNPDTPVQYNVRGIPTILFFKNGKNIERTVGAVNKQLILDKLEHIKLL